MNLDLQGHRGARGHAPENTLPGFERALAIGVDTLELDVGVTRDGVVVIHHDRRLNPDVARGPDGKWVTAPAPTIHSLSFHELQAYDVGRIRPGSEYAQRFPHQKPIDGTRIPRLEELFAAVKHTKVRFNIETKLVPEAPGRDACARAVRARADRRSAQGRRRGAHHDPVVRFPHAEGGGARGARDRHGLPDVRQELGSRAGCADAGARIWSPNFQDLDARQDRGGARSRLANRRVDGERARRISHAFST